MLWVGSSGAAQPSAAAYPNTEGFGIAFDKAEDWYRHCMRVERLAYPPARADGERCDAVDLYYVKREQASTSAAEWRQVHACARAAGDDAVLMMLHANGYGVPRDTDRALHHACKLDSAKAEMEGRVTHLASGAAAPDGQPFDLCDHVTSGRMGSVCAGLKETRTARARNTRLDRLATTLPAAAQAPFVQLRKAADAFASQSQSEVDMQGTGAAGFAVAHAASRRNEFLDTVLAATRGKLAPVSASEFARLDARLNAAYRKLLAAPRGQENWKARIGQSTVTRADLRATERAWLAYRDAWIPFLRAARLPADPVAVKAALTRQRLAQLERI
ncbi:hypothetical protein ASF77_14500 [Massilia sp. Leaf139]|nr:hypothetical protein ASF77_14500 [Massilia sp. Leaf139]